MRQLSAIATKCSMDDHDHEAFATHVPIAGIRAAGTEDDAAAGAEDDAAAGAEDDAAAADAEDDAATADAEDDEREGCKAARGWSGLFCIWLLAEFGALALARRLPLGATFSLSPCPALCSASSLVSA
jgi:hypothetical protein